ncbi:MULTISPECIES: hypothetical protein [Pantoea]|jgi:hypothetical protein|nr:MULTISPECIES: hypothetical protein [Pantoea]MCS3402513.1 hypothetical protein [Pantoea sp. B566]MCS4493696.1 hypothetical protein [Pantoea sp. B623]
MEQDILIIGGNVTGLNIAGVQYIYAGIASSASTGDLCSSKGKQLS